MHTPIHFESRSYIYVAFLLYLQEFIFKKNKRRKSARVEIIWPSSSKVYPDPSTQCPGYHSRLPVTPAQVRLRLINQFQQSSEATCYPRVISVQRSPGYGDHVHNRSYTGEQTHVIDIFCFLNVHLYVYAFFFHAHLSFQFHYSHINMLP